MQVPCIVRSVALLLAAATLAGCETPPKPAPAPAPAPAPEPVVAAPPAPAAPPAAPAGPASPAAAQQAQKSALAAVELLESGNEDGAKNEIRRALALDPKNALAVSLQEQISADPFARLGRDSFAYTVRPGETLSMVAKRYLGDIYMFYLLARYNGIAVPRLVAAGQVLRIPGKTPPPAAPPPIKPVRKDVIETKPPAPVPGPPPPPPVDVAKADEARARSAQRYASSARSCFSKQDLDCAIGNWQRTLEADPDYPGARSELERMRALKRKLETK